MAVADNSIGAASQPEDLPPLWIDRTLRLALAACLIDVLSWRSENYSLMSSEMISPYGAGWWLWMIAITGAATRLTVLLVRAPRPPDLIR